MPLIQSIQGPLGFEVKVAERTVEQLKAQPDKIFRAYQDEKVLKRASRLNRELDRLRILWVDDHPENEAEAILRQRDIGLIISDIGREDKSESGLSLLEKLRAQGRQIPLIFYIENPEPDKGTPPGAAGLTNRPDDLFHLIFHVAEKLY